MLKPDVLVVQTTPAAAAMQAETSTIPIVFTNVSDPVGSGLITSLSHPGGNITGILLYEQGIVSKWLAMLKEIAPRQGGFDRCGSDSDFGRCPEHVR